jgi:hypothetical protein
MAFEGVADYACIDVEVVVIVVVLALVAVCST